jgi:hypothetical protein
VATTSSVNQNRDDGGPAFPRPLSKLTSEEVSPDQEGMKLRDYFAAHAPEMSDEAFKLLKVNEGESLESWLARREAMWASTFADAMLAERRR